MSVFDFVGERLEQGTDLDRLEARGTLRLALKGAGLDAASVTAEQMAVVVARVLADELRSRGIERADAVCEGLLQGLKSLDPNAEPSADSPEAIFRRLARS